MIKSFFATLGGGPVRASSDWGTTSGASPHSSPSRTLTVPGGNPGNLRLNVAGAGSAIEYKKNAGAFTGFVDGATITVANGDTLQFRLTGSSSDNMIVTVTDTTKSVTVGTWDGSIA